MPITGSQKAPLVARLKVKRLGATRLGYAQPVMGIIINGVVRTNHVRVAGLSIRDELDGTPNTATLRVDGPAPSKGHEIKIYLGDTFQAHLLFGGHILEVTQVYDLIPAHLAYDLSCISYEWLLNRRKVTARYRSTSATAIAIDLMTRFTAGFWTTGVQASLASLDEITFTNQDMTDCLDRLAKRIGGRWIVDPAKVLHFGLDLQIGASPVHPITEAAPHGLIGIAIASDLSQVRTRVLIEGGGAPAASELLPGAPMLPVLDAAWYNPAGGTVTSGPQRITYTGLLLGGVGALVGAVPTPTNAPTLTAALGAGLGSGLYGYAQTFTDSTGETLPGPTAFVTLGGQLAAPATGPTLTAQPAAPALSNGTYIYAVTFTDALGETLPGPSAILTISTYIVAPTIGATVVATLLGGGLSAGIYQWAYTFVNAAGQETDGYTSGSAPITLADLAAPASAPTGTPTALTGNLSAGSYLYRVSYLDSAGGETMAGPASAAVVMESIAAPGSAPSGTMQAGGNIDLGQHSWKLTYVDSVGGETTPNTTPLTLSASTSAPVALPAGFTSWVPHTGGSLAANGIYYHKLTFITATGETGYTGGATGGPIGSGNTAVTMGFTPSGDGRVTGQRIYRSSDSGTTYGLIATLAASATSYTDTGAAQGAAMPPTNTTAVSSRTAALTNIPVSPDSHVTKRRIYRTAAGGGTFGLVVELPNNTATTYLDTLADGSRGVNPPGTSTALYRTAHLTNIPVSPDGNVTKRRVYRTAANGATYGVVVELPNNTATTYLDTLADASRGAAPPGTATSVYRSAQLTIPTSPDSQTTRRRVYRTAANGGTFQLVTEIANNTTTNLIDTLADAARGGVAPATNTTGKDRCALSALPFGPSGTTGRKLYRTGRNGSALQLLATIADNTTTTYTDSAADSALGAPVPTTATTGTANQTSLTAIPLGPAGTTNRKLYRTVVDGSALQLLTTIAGNTATTYTDTAPDAALGAAAPTSNTSGLVSASGTLNAGSTVVPITASGPFPASGAWVQAGGLAFRYQAKTDTSLTGVPASGNGAVLSSLNYGTEVTVLPALTGIPISGPGAIVWTIPRGEDVNVLVTREDVAAQAVMAGLEGGDGIHEDFIQDRRLSRLECEDRGDARLLEVKNPEVRITYATRDSTTRSGRDVTITLAAPAVNGTFRIQRVTISDFDPLMTRPPVRQVEASSRRFSFEALLRLIKGT